MWKRTLLIVVIIIFGYVILDYLDMVYNYWEIINILPLSSNVKRIISYLKFNKFNKFNKPISRVTIPTQPPQNNNNNNKNNNNKRQVSQIHKKMVASNQKWKCRKCQNLLDYTYEIDHITPLYKGGSNDISNLQALCRNCHGKKTIRDEYL